MTKHILEKKMVTVTVNVTQQHIDTAPKADTFINPMSAALKEADPKHRDWVVGRTRAYRVDPSKPDEIGHPLPKEASIKSRIWFYDHMMEPFSFTMEIPQ